MNATGTSSPAVTARRILVTGVTGMVAGPIAEALAADNEVWAAARFSDTAAREHLEQTGIRCVVVDLAGGDLSSLPTDFDYVLNFAAQKSGGLNASLVVNAEGLGLLMAHCKSATAFLHCSSTAVYADTEEALTEAHMLGDNHGPAMPGYSISKIAAEAVARTAARQFNVPTTIARLNVPYSDSAGWPGIHLDQILAGKPIAVHSESPCAYCPIHLEDMLRTLPGLLDAASVPATIVNWGGHQRVTIEEWCDHLGAITGRKVEYLRTPRTLRSVVVDTSKLNALAGPTLLDWHEGLERMVANRLDA